MYEQIKPIENIVFDCDSTLTTIEGINELAALVNKRDEITELTRKAMDGEVPLEGVFFERMDMIRPTYDQIRQIGKLYCRSLSTSARSILEIAKFLGKKVYIFSGGYLPCLRILAQYLQIVQAQVFAVDLIFDGMGEFLYCPRDQLLTLTDGKLRLAKELNFSHDQTVMIGDGANDMSVSETVDLFIGYQGEKENRFMKENAKVFLQGDDLLPILSLILTDKEKRYLSTTYYSQLIQQADQLAEERILIK